MKKVVIIISIIFGGFMLSINSNGSEKVSMEEKAYYRNLEDSFTDLIRNYLEKEGYKNCGITVSSIINCDEREYTVMIHHIKLSNLDECEKEKIILKLEAMTYPYENCDVNFSIID